MEQGQAKPAGFERRLERDVLRRVWLLSLVFLPGIAAINALTLMTEGERAGAVLDWREPWILEITSALSLGLLVPGVAALERRFPITRETWRSAALAHLAGSAIFSAAHILGMWLFRSAFFAAVLGQSYHFFMNPVADVLYEYRKDLLPYFFSVLLLKLTRDMLEARREAEVARAEARATGRLTLRSGGRMLMLDGAKFAWARSAGNYVEVSVGEREFLARTTLSALLDQLTEARIAGVRIHRTLVINAAHIREVRPLRDGDYTVVLTDGTNLKGSRRYKSALASSSAVWNG